MQWCVIVHEFNTAGRRLAANRLENGTGAGRGLELPLLQRQQAAQAIDRGRET